MIKNSEKWEETTRRENPLKEGERSSLQERTMERTKKLPTRISRCRRPKIDEEDPKP